MITTEELGKKVLGELDTYDIINYLKSERDLAFMSWCTSDLIYSASSIGFVMDEDTAKDILSTIDSNADCNYGITWETLEYHIQDWINENTFEVIIADIETKVESTVNFCAIETNEYIDEYWNDDNYYFYGTSRDDLKEFEGEEYAECIIVKVF